MKAAPSATSTLVALPGAWIVVACLWFGGGLNYLDRLMLTTMHDSIIEAIPMTEKEFGLLTAIFLFVYGAFSPLAGFISDRLNRSLVIIGSVFIWSAVTWLTSQATTYNELLFARALMGISEACYIPAALALIADYHPSATRSLAIGVFMSGISVGASLGGYGGKLADKYDWTVPFQVFGMIGIVFSVLLIAVLRNPPKSPTVAQATASQRVGFLEAFSHLFSNGRYLLILVCFSLMGFAGWALNGWMPVHLKEQFSMDQGRAGILTTSFLHIAGFTGSITGGFLSDFWNRSNPSARFLMPVVGLCIAAPGVLLAGTGFLLPFAVLGLVIYGVSRQFADTNLMPILCVIADTRYRATGYGIMNFCSCLVGGIGIYAGGALRDAQVDIAVIFFTAAAGLFFTAFLFWQINRSSKVEHTAPTTH